MNMAKTAVSHSSSEARGPAEAQGPEQGPTSPMPRAGSDTNSFPVVCVIEFTRKATVKRHFKKCSAEHGVTGVVL